MRRELAGLRRATVDIRGEAFIDDAHFVALSIGGSEKRFTADVSTIPSDLTRSIFFTVLFEPNEIGGSGGWKPDPMSTMKFASLALASAANLKGDFVLVIPQIFKHRQVLHALIETYQHMAVEEIPDGEIFKPQESRTNWVLQVERLKLAFLRRMPKGKQCIYVELDQLYLPGSGQAFEAIFASQAFDIAYTYKKTRDTFGSTNTGVILFRTSENVLQWQENITKKTSELTGRKCQGGENQLAIDRFVPHLAWGKRFFYSGVWIYALQYPGPLNENTIDCCTLASGTFIAHFKSHKKPLAMSSCCRDRVQVHAEAWLAECTCKQDKADSHCWPSRGSSNRTANDWCAANRMS